MSEACVSAEMTDQTVRAEDSLTPHPEDLPFREKPDGTLDPAGEAGWYLQREREARGLSLDQAGEDTGIHPYHIDAIEHGDMTRMPARMEALEMIGAYAQYLGFDPEPLVMHYAEFLPSPAVAPVHHPANPAPLTSAKILSFGKLPKMPQFKLSSIPGGVGGLVASVAGAIFLFAGASWILMPGSSDIQPTEQVAQQMGEADPMPTATTAANDADVAVSQQPMPEDQPVASADEPAVDETAGTGLDGLTQLIEKNVEGAAPAYTASVKPGVQTAPPPVMNDEVASVEPPAAPASAPAEQAADARLVLKAKAPVWVRIEDKSGNVVMTQMLMKGETYRVPNRDGLIVIARDGGLLSYIIDGKEKGVLGSPGEILVGKSLDIKTLEGNG